MSRPALDLGEILRFGLVGGTNTVLAFAVYSLFIHFGTPYYLALVFDYLFAIVFSLVANKFFTFKTGAHLDLGVFLRMALSYLVMFLVNEGMLALLVARAAMNAYVAQAIASVLIAGLSYLMQKFLVFGKGGQV